MRKLELIGTKVGKLTVVGPAPHDVGTHRKWECLCECGATVTLRSTQIASEAVKSCGCLRKERGTEVFSKHGMYYRSSYTTWNKMMTRCHNPRSKAYAEYGAVGIFVCERWKDVKNFIEDMGERPEKASIDRIDNCKGYEPGNCRWATAKEQANNTRRNVRVAFEGEEMTLTQVAEAAGVDYKKLHFQFRSKGLAIDEAVKAANNLT